jgi:hypothetical protein
MQTDEVALQLQEMKLAGAPEGGYFFLPSM